MNQKLLSVAKGEAPADLVIRNGKIVNVYSGEIYDGGVAVCGDTIAAVGDVDYCIGEGTNVVDALSINCLLSPKALLSHHSPILLRCPQQAQ